MVLGIRSACFVMIFLVMFCMKLSNGKVVPALFLFGDSLVDVGNNNHLPISFSKANVPHNGIDYPTHKSTGRFSNGKNAADFLADKLGLPTSPPYLYLRHINSSNFSGGVNFASGSSGLFDGANELALQAVSMGTQIKHYALVKSKIVQQMGEKRASELLSRSVFVIVVGSNDILGKFGSFASNVMKKVSPQEHVATMVQTVKGQLKNIYDLGARKFIMIGVPPVGCSPAQRAMNKEEVCNEAANFWAGTYNQELLLVLQELKLALKGFRYSYFNTFDVLQSIIRQPSNYGFKEVKAACCGLGKLNAIVPCLPISTYCKNRSDHVFWDFYHPTEATDRIFIDIAFNGPKKYSFPVNVQELVSS